MKRFLIIFLVFFIACSNGSEESNEVIETTATTTQETTTTLSTTTTTSSTTTTTTTTTTIPVLTFTSSYELQTETYPEQEYSNLGSFSFCNSLSEKEIDWIPLDNLKTDLELLVEKNGDFAIWSKVNIGSENLNYFWEGSVAKPFSSDSSTVELSMEIQFNHFLRNSSKNLIITSTSNNLLNIEDFTTNDYGFDIYTTEIFGKYSITIDDENFTGDLYSVYDTRGSGTDIFTNVDSEFKRLDGFDLRGSGGNNLCDGWTPLIDNEFNDINIKIIPWRATFNASKSEVELNLVDN